MSWQLLVCLGSIAANAQIDAMRKTYIQKTIKQIKKNYKMKKLLLIAMTVSSLAACTEETCYKCTMKSTEKLGEYDLTNSVNRCEADIVKYMEHMIARDRIDWIECENGDEFLRLEK